MAKITRDQQTFLDRHEIPASTVFDATGMRRSHYQREMEQEEKIIAIGVSPCKTFGHTMRTRAGHCVQCSPANIEFIKRHFRNAEVYVAGSMRSKLIKVGSASAPYVRIELLNQRGYGDISDWRLLSHVRCENSGKVEFDIHRRLSSYAVSRSYLREGLAVECREIFSCGYNAAHQAMNDVLGAQALSDLWEHKGARAIYNFSDRFR